MCRTAGIWRRWHGQVCNRQRLRAIYILPNRGIRKSSPCPAVRPLQLPPPSLSRGVPRVVEVVVVAEVADARVHAAIIVLRRRGDGGGRHSGCALSAVSYESARNGRLTAPWMQHDGISTTRPVACRAPPDSARVLRNAR
eukprot:IDg4893t1